MQVIVGCDSDSVIDVAQHHDYVTQNSRHRDVVVSLIEVRKIIKTALLFRKIKGHADKLKPFHLLSRLEPLNVYCDKTAKCARVTLEPVHTSSSPFFKEGISTWINDQKLYCNAKDYLTDKYQKNDSQFESIDWLASK